MKSKNHSDLIEKVEKHSINLDKDMNHKKIIFFDHMVQLEVQLYLSLV